MMRLQPFFFRPQLQTGSESIFASLSSAAAESVLRSRLTALVLPSGSNVKSGDKVSCKYNVFASLFLRKEEAFPPLRSGMKRTGESSTLD